MERPPVGGAVFEEVRNSGGRFTHATDTELFWPYCPQMPRRPGWSDLPDGSDVIWRNGIGMPRAMLPEGWTLLVEA